MFKVGDKITRKSGTASQIVYMVDYSKALVWATYEKTREDFYPKGQHFTEIQLAESQAKERETNMTQFYETNHPVNGSKVFVNKLAVNSENKWVVEVKGTGEVFALEKTKLTEVVPYTVEITFLDGPNKHYSYLSSKGKFEVGDILVMSEGALAVVKAVNSKSKTATKELEPIGRVMVEKFNV